MRITLIFLLIQIGVYAQTSYTIEAVPKVIFANYEGNGIIPAGFVLRKYNPGISFGLTLNQRIYKKMHLCLGTNLHINNYYSSYYRDFDSDKKSPYTRNLMRSSYFEPKLMVSFNDIVLLKRNGFFFEAGVGYSISNSPGITYKSTKYGENAYGIMDTVSFVTTLLPMNNSKFKFLLGFGKNVDLGKSNFVLGFGCNLRLSQAEEIVFKEITDNGKYYTFDYKRNSTYVGVNLRLTYKYRKASRISED